MMLGALAGYGLRAKLISRASALTLLGSYIALFFFFHRPADEPMLHLDTGYWIAAVVAVPILYAALITVQRQEPPRRTPSKTEQWTLLYLMPLYWLLFHLLGEDLTRGGNRR